MRTKIIVLTSILSAILYTNTAATVLYVDDDANGLNNGKNWENAYNYLQDAIAGSQNVVKPVEIRIAQGIYRPDLGTAFTQGDRYATFDLINSISLAGGYAGLGQADPNVRDIELYKTILSGDLNSNDTNDPDISTLYNAQSRTDNSFRIITCRSIHNSTYIDGLTITAGNANNATYQNGSGIYNYYSDLRVRNCTFIENSANNGGGVYNYNCNPTYTNCKFIDNMAQIDGGGIYNYRGAVVLSNCTINGNVTVGDGSGMYNSYSNPTLTNCTFSSNMAKSEGGGMFNEESAPKITDCLFNSNLAKNDGGAIFNSNNSNPTITNCTFSENTADDCGAGIYNNSQSNPTITSCSFTGNSANNGGGMYNYNNCDPVIKNCTFNENKAASSGAGTYNNNNSDPTITDCTYTENISDNEGGGIYNYSNSAPNITNCIFKKNSATGGGGASNSGCSAKFTNCSFIENEGTLAGGGMYNSIGTPQITNCVFSKNKTFGNGGGMANSGSSAKITDCTFSGNTSNSNGGGMSNHNSSKTVIANCMFSKNHAAIYAGGMYNQSSKPTLTNCIFSQNSSEKHGGGMCNDESSPVLTGCTFRSNNAEVSGGGIYNLLSNVSSIKKCLFTENTAGTSGGAINNDKCTTTLPNSIFLANSALYGGGVNNTNNSKINVLNCTFEGNVSLYGDAVSCFSGTEDGNDVPPSIVKVTNCILWDESEEIYNDGNSTITVAYCDIKSGQSNSHDPNEMIIWGDGNIEADPCFANPGHWNLNQTPEDANDDFYVEGDYHLKSQAGRIRQNSQSWIVDDVTSLCIDAGDPAIPLYYEPYPNGNRTNIGAYAGTNEASKSPYVINYFSKADYPEPDDGFAGSILDPILCWSSDANAIEHEIYFGTEEFPPFIGKLSETEFYPGLLKTYTQYYWRVDDIDSSLNRVSGDIWTFKTGYYPNYPYNPRPRKGAKNVIYDTKLTWNPGYNNRFARVYYYDLYLGTDFNDVYNATFDNTLDVLEYSNKKSYDSNYYKPDGLKFNQTYYWRIDEQTSSGSGTAKIKGNVWSFTTGSKPIQAYYPYPADNTINVSVTTILSWSPGSLNPAAYDIYIGTNMDNVNNATIANPLNCLVSIAHDSNYYSPGQLYSSVKYYWRIDQADSNGVAVKGKIWSFTTLRKSRSCFPADTPVWVDGKMMEISKVVAGQKVGKDDCDMSTFGSVKGLDEHGTGMIECYEMTLESGNSIAIVNSHYFKTVSGEWKKIEELSAGMQLQTMNGPIAIKSIIKKEKPFVGKSYNLILDGSEQYFVGIDGVVALDCSKKTWEILEEARK